MQPEIFEDVILIPKERVSVLVGSEGSTKKTLEKKGKIKLDIDSQEGSVKIVAKDAFDLWVGRQVVNAIGRGFSAEIAQKLFIEGNTFELIHLSDYASKSKKDLQRLRGRVIGEDGRSKRIIQRYTGTDIVIYGKTVGIIGLIEQVDLARHAVEMLLKGSKHGTVFRFIRDPDRKDVKRTKRTSGEATS